MVSLVAKAEQVMHKVYVHPISNNLVVFIWYERTLNDALLEWRDVSGSGRGRTYASTVFRDDGRWVKYEGTTNVLPYSHRS